MMEPSPIWRAGNSRARILLEYARRVPSHPGKLRLFRWLATQLVGSNLVLRLGSKVTLAVDPLDFIGHQLCFSGSFEPFSLALAVRLMRGGGFFVDVGCNIGIYSCVVGAETGAPCVAIDASREAIRRLEDNLRRNPQVRAVVLHAAASDRWRLLAVEEPEQGNLGMTRTVVPGAVGGSLKGFVGAAALEDLLLAARVDEVSLLKMDIEGAELEALRGLDLDGPFRPRNLLIEHNRRLSGAAGSPDRALDYLIGKGYAPKEVSGAPYTGARAPLEENLWLSDTQRPAS